MALETTFSGTSGCYFHQYGPSPSQGYVSVGKICFSVDQATPTVVDGTRANGLPVAPQYKVPDIGAAGSINMAVDTTQAFPVSPGGMPGLAAEVSGTFSGTLIPEVLSVAGGTWDAVSVVQRGGANSGTLVAAITGPLRFTHDIAGASQFRLRCSVVGSGSANVAYTMTAGQNLISIECGDPNRTKISAASLITAPQLAPAVTAAAYTTGQVIGGLLAFTGQPTTGYVTDAVLTLASGTFTGTIDLLLFSANPTASTVADHGALTLAAADLPKLIGVLHLTDNTAAGTAAIVQGQNLGQPYALAAAGTTIYAIALLRGTVTFATTADLTATLGVVR